MNIWEVLTGAASLALRLSAYVFLRWIPGHHFPPLILTLLAVYLGLIYLKSHEFEHLTLHEAFPALFKQTEITIVQEQDADVIEVVEVEYDDPSLYEDEHPFWKTLLLGVPDWREREFTFITAAINVLLALLTIDLVFRGPLLNPANDLRFSRVGYVDDVSAKVLFREPDASQLPVYSYLKRQDVVSFTEVDRTYRIGPETDYTHPLTFNGLIPDMRYDYILSNGLNGSFSTASAPGSSAANSLIFITSSCIKANFPYRLFSNSLSIHGFEHLSKLLQSIPTSPAFMLFLGDFIYVDVPRRLSSTFSHYRSEYRRVYASPSWNLPGISSIPWIHTLDDHEIANDWSGGNQTSPFPEASDPFMNYHVSVNPPIPLRAPPVSDENTTYFQFTRGPASFFMLDTRRYRTNPQPAGWTPQGYGEFNTCCSELFCPNEVDRVGSISKPLYGSSKHASNPPTPGCHATMLGQSQLSALRQYLDTPEPAGVHWKIIASSVPFTKNWRFGTSDTWGGFMHERDSILWAMRRAERLFGIRVIMLSGDRHEFAAIRYPQLLENMYNEDGQVCKSTSPSHDPRPQAGPHEFSVGPLSMFYLPIRTFKQVDEQDVAVAYIPDGNSKVGVLEIQNDPAIPTPVLDVVFDYWPAKRVKEWFLGKPHGGLDGVKPWYEGRAKSMLKYTLWVDGKVKWEYKLTSPAYKDDYYGPRECIS